MKKISSLLWGFVFIIVGIIFGLNALELTNINIFFDGWWTLFIIVPCFINLFKNEDITSNFIGLVIGICLLLGCQDIVEFDLIRKLIVPFILVMIGISFIFKNIFNKKIKENIKKLNDKENKEYYACFSGQKLDFNKEEFTGCSLNAVFGGIECDLRNAIIKEDIVINASSVFGSVTIYAPEDVNIKTSSTSIFGGVSNKKNNKTKDEKYTIYINATAMFGGVEVK